MTPPRCLLFEDVAPGLPFHAALALFRPPPLESTRHTHDFSEVFYVLEGVGLHLLNEKVLPLHTGDLVWLRPFDCHTLGARRGRVLHFINIAFPHTAWRDWCRIAGVDGASWERGSTCPTVQVPPEQRGECTALFERTLRAFHDGPSRLEICRFWGDLMSLLLPSSSISVPDDLSSSGPAWLVRAQTAMGNPDNLRAGVPRFVELAGTSAAHLARVLKHTDGRTPTEWVSERRLHRAARLLLTTTQEIVDIADDCGFNNLSYFYRCFHSHTGKTPRGYRLAARRPVMPPS